MNNLFSMHSFVVILLSLAAGSLYAWLLYASPGGLRRPQRILFAGLRTVAVAAIFALLFLPPYRSMRYEVEKPLIVIAQDNSPSVSHTSPSGFDRRRYEQDLKKLVRELRNDYQVEVLHFNERAASGLNFKPNGKFTDAAAMASGLVNRLMNRNVGAIVMATDGIFNRGGNPQYLFAQLAAPVYTIALGDATVRRDLAVSDVRYNDMAYLDNVFNVEVAADAYKSQGERSELAIYEKGKKLDSKPVRFDKAESHQTITLKVRASSPGIHQYTVRLAPLNGESTTLNNSQSFFVDVIDGRQKILLAAAAPHPDMAAIRQALEGNRHFEVTTAIGPALEKLNPADYNLVVLYQLPFLQGNERIFLNKLPATRTPLWYIVGAQSDLRSLSMAQQAVKISASGGSLQEAHPYPAITGTAFMLDPANAGKLKNFDPLQLPFSQLDVSAQVTPVLLRRIGRLETGVPMLFFTAEAGRKQGFLLGEGLWRWRLAEAKEGETTPAFNELIQKSAQFLTAKDDKRKLRVATARPGFEENEHVLFHASLYNDSYEPVTEATIRMQVRSESGKRYNFVFSPSEDHYRLDAGTFSQGNYAYEASASFKNKNYSFQGRFFVTSTQLEYRQTTADHQLLQSLSAQSSGKRYRPADLLNITNDLKKNPDIRTVSYEDLRYEEPVGIKTVFFLVLLLLTAEWLMRKRNGAV
ncbi:hypothetical protein C7T94_16545 [Pedobacter yulinensis]|uniref:VWA domain-containing protein n=1 Tax=Pedobacter yulinensis TaxID=2126353 RepID=A0A2T3HIV6_9SPHI|nr:hypothetical protein [Pedobacter yulinensis]PST82385.1 hypothetical protein C7T94_16545 [Pedobacter yulinensis]